MDIVCNLMKLSSLCVRVSLKKMVCACICVCTWYTVRDTFLTDLRASTYGVDLGSLVRLDFDFVCFRHLFVMIKDSIIG